MRKLKEFESYICQPDIPLRDALTRFNRLKDPFLVVIDGEGRPIGTLTDGDVRRGILAGHDASAPVSHIMNTSPLLAVRGEVSRFSLPRDRQIGFVPVVDERGRLCEIWLPGRGADLSIDALVMAGGFGRRMGERTRDKPKPLLEVGGRPLLEHTLSWLENARVGHIYVSVHYLADQIAGYMEARNSPVPYSLVHEEKPLGTAGALSLLADQLHRPILVVNADVLTRLDLPALLEFHAAHGNDGTLAVAPYKVDVPFGVVRQDQEGRFAGIEEKPSYSYFISSGIYLLAPEFARLHPRGEAIDMPDLLMRGRQAGLSVGLFPVHEYWRDVGRERDYQEAQVDHD